MDKVTNINLNVDIAYSIAIRSKFKLLISFSLTCKYFNTECVKQACLHQFLDKQYKESWSPQENYLVLSSKKKFCIIVYNTCPHISVHYIKIHGYIYEKHHFMKYMENVAMGCADRYKVKNYTTINVDINNRYNIISHENYKLSYFKSFSDKNEAFACA